MRLDHQDFAVFNEAVAKMYVLAFRHGALWAIAQTLPDLLGGEVGVAGVISNAKTSFMMSQTEVEQALQKVPPELFSAHPRMRREDLQGNVVMISDLLSRHDWHRQELYQVSREVHGLEEDLGTDFRLGDGSMGNACVMRKRRTFQERDRDLFTLLLPHIRALLDWGCPRCAPGLGGLGLTRREQEVLSWISEGKTNSEVGQILGIAAGTVKIHLERIYRKLGVENRHGATLKALEKLHGGLPAPPYSRPSREAS
ncbi:helix-turn-helix transcriptional regulator [Verrucomicrobium sp. BvORR034]|uniref:helix-turn-helix transcriptional regulator n=1 Tax=Verrucomicrobium sp. BvORR034 TaxID=1396418 RepID=UPI0006794530|nr:helix-turn-helix transcriptional regulator [Verrucomicrobium sp. BvORR034]